MNIIHVALIAAFFFTGIVSLITGLLVVAQRRTGALFQVHLWAMIATLGSLIAVVLWDWFKFPLISQMVYAVLCLVGIYTVYKGFLAQHKQFHRFTGWWLEFLEDIGFTIVSLFTWLVIVGFIDMGLPVWAAVLVGIAGILAGRQWLQYSKNKYLVDRKGERF